MDILELEERVIIARHQENTGSEQNRIDVIKARANAAINAAVRKMAHDDRAECA